MRVIIQKNKHLEPSHNKKTSKHRAMNKVNQNDLIYAHSNLAGEHNKKPKETEQIQTE